MPAQALGCPEVAAAALDSPGDEHRFFDPRSPEQPEQILGVDTEAILRLGGAATALGALPPRVNLGLYALPDAVRLIPLVEEMQAGATLTPEDIRPYRKPIKKLKPEINFADKLAASAGAVAVGVPLRRALNRKIEREFPDRAADAIERAREVVASIENDVDHVAGFENPKEQFVAEMNELARTVSTAITEQRDRRVQSGGRTESKHETPKGMTGIFVKAMRQVKSFFGIFSRKPKVNPEITAYDAGTGIEKTIMSLARNQEDTQHRLPMLSKLLLNRLPATIPVTSDKLALAAPEILKFLFSVSPEDQKGRNLIRSVTRNPHELRFVTHFKKHYGRYSLEGIQRASTTLMPAIRDVLPSRGDKVREIFDQAQDLLRPKDPGSGPGTAEIDGTSRSPKNETARKRVISRVKNLFRRKRGKQDQNLTAR